MLSAQLEERFVSALGAVNLAGREESVRFGVDFTRLLARIVPDEVSAEARAAMSASVAARCQLSGDEIQRLLDLCLAPEVRAAIDDSDLRAFGARFGHAEEEALRAAVAEEMDLPAFSERYGSEEALLLLDSLFAVCAVDGVIDPQEISRLTHAAQALGIDEMLVGALFRKHDVRHATGEFTFQLDKERYIIGRGDVADVRLPDPQVAIRHAELIRSGDEWRIVDLRSGRPTLLNGVAVQSAPFRAGEQLRVGPYTLRMDSSEAILTVFGTGAFSALSVRNLSRKIGDISLLDEVSFTVFSGEVIAVVGPSGAGKTTLLNAIAGIALADSGDVLLDGENFHSLLASDRSIVGIVPQDDVVHAELTVEESLYYSGRLRFRADVGKAEIQDAVDRVLRELDIEHIRNSRIGDAVRRGVSGGQRKRVNLGQELLTRSTQVLFLDEPTSGLDPQTGQGIVSLVRQLADDGRIIFLVTHDVTPSVMSMVDHLLVLAPGGRLAWFGPPEDAATWFGVDSPDEIFARMPDYPPVRWKEKYRDGTAFRKYVRTRQHTLGLDTVEVAPVEVLEGSSFSWGLHYFTLLARYAKVKVRDVTGTAVLLAQAPFLAVAIWIVFPEPDAATMYMLAFASLWFGASSSIRELISDRTIWRREHRVGLGLIPYMTSKVTVLGLLVSFQCTALSTMVYLMLGMGAFGFSLPALAAMTSLTGLSGVAMGLAMSAMFTSSEAAVGTLPLTLIPQLAFGGLIVKVKEMSVLAKGVSAFMVTRYAFDAAIKTGEELSRPGSYGNKRESLRITGVLYDLGFRSSSADDMGLSIWTLTGIMVLFFGFFMLLATWFTRRAARGN
ncbi:MAG: ATP-binding cassette domain-containing protein [Deltaproteobacteria bacterium]|nr:ATP-binding cassette domain-containing protein [Deltaproteobacteria bacterium]